MFYFLKDFGIQLQQSTVTFIARYKITNNQTLIIRKYTEKYAS